MRKNLKKENLIKCLVVGICVLLTGCGSIGLAREAAFESAYENLPEEEVEIYTSEGYGILEAVDEEKNTLTVYRLDKKEEMVFAYDGATMVQDKFGGVLVMTQLSPGDIIGIQYSSELQKAGTVTMHSDSWSYHGASRYDIDEGRGTLQIGSDTYRISKETKAFSGTEQISMDEILNQDVLSFRGIGRDIFSIVVENGHGYLNLENDEKLIGGWIEVGQTAIQQITEDMLLTVPEGNYMVRLSAKGVEETREVTIARNQETVLDVSDVEVPEPVSGKVSFVISPIEASVYVDGVGINTSYTVLLPFGLHQITASAPGFDTVSQYFEVEGETTYVKLALSESKGSTVSGNSEESDSSHHTITIQTPEDVEVYHDNLYMGISPVTFEKKTGSHTITLRKRGYITRSYQIEVADDDRDLTYSFPDLVPETENASSVSGNSAKGSDSSTVSGNETVSGNGTSSSGGSTSSGGTSSGSTSSGGNKPKPKPTVSGNGTTVSGNEIGG